MSDFFAGPYEPAKKSDKDLLHYLNIYAEGMSLEREMTVEVALPPKREFLFTLGGQDWLLALRSSVERLA